jgi:xylan 1,4-beta-xylosidase
MNGRFLMGLSILLGAVLFLTLSVHAASVVDHSSRLTFDGTSSEVKPAHPVSPMPRGPWAQVTGSRLTTPFQGSITRATVSNQPGEVPLLAGDAVLSADFSEITGTIRRLNGINKGPLVLGGMVDVIREQTELGIPFTRLHDCGWPNPYVVDHHAVFPNPNADPALPESYDFRLTDEYIEAVRRTGSEPIYRLGESIEHTGVKRHVHPPADMDRWAAVCCGIIRHYNQGWANGFHHNIRYWEIWNEPENRPAMWSGTDDDYLRLYRTAAVAIKDEFPTVEVGGPSLGASGSFVQGEFVPTEFANRFLAMCRRDSVPLNFFSWHCYTADPAELGTRSRAIRRLLDSNGFTETENHLNEWNFLPNSDWQPISKTATPAAR